MSKIGIIGATGTAGAAIFKEATARGHEVTAIVRNSEKAKALFGEKILILEKDAFALFTEDLQGFDVVVNAFAPTPDKAYLHVDFAGHLVHFFRETETPRFFFILGAGSLKTGNDHHLLVEDLEKLPDSQSWIATPQNQLTELHLLEGVTNVNWVGVSPSQTFQAGPATKFMLGKDHLLINEKNKSVTSSGTIAVAILDEIEQPTFHQERFTVVDTD